MNERKFRKYKAAKAKERGVDYYERESVAHHIAKQAKRTRTLLRKRKEGDEALLLHPLMQGKSQLARAHHKHERLGRRNGKVSQWYEVE